MTHSGDAISYSPPCQNYMGHDNTVRVMVDNSPVKDTFQVEHHLPFVWKCTDSCVVPLPSDQTDSCVIHLPGTQQHSLVPATSMQFGNSEQFNLTCEALEISLLPNGNVLPKSCAEMLHVTIGVHAEVEDVTKEHSRQCSRSYCNIIDCGHTSECSFTLQQESSKTLLTVPSLSDLLGQRVSFL